MVCSPAQVAGSKERREKQTLKQARGGATKEAEPHR